jgi:small-conductance mechanosensitive channel
LPFSENIFIFGLLYKQDISKKRELMMSLGGWMNKILIGWGIDPKFADMFDETIIALLMVGLSIGLDYLCQAIFVGGMKHYTRRSPHQWNTLLMKRRVIHHLIHILPGILIYYLLPMAFVRGKEMLEFSQKVCAVYIIVAVLLTINGLLLVLLDVYNMKDKQKNRPLKGFVQVLQVLLFFIGGIIVVSVLIGKSPMTLFAGLGASAAVLMLVFKDSILGFVAGVQLSANDMLRIGDWIALPGGVANGVVEEITLNTVKIRNWDETISTVPPYTLVNNSFQNWRGMRESGGRRVKRSINIDMTSVRFCTPEMLAKYRKIQLLKDYVEQTEEVIEKYNVENGIDNSILVNGRRQTNLGVFRAYLTAYLKSLPDVNQELTCMVRQLQPTDRGIPIELYFFCALKDWVPYEGVQADVFDHVLAIIPEFDLQVFQSPSGRDFQRVLPAASEEKGA